MEPAFEKKAEISAAIGQLGQPLSAKYVWTHEAELIGRTVLVEGFLSWLCDEDQEPGCSSSADHFLIFSGDSLPAAPGPLHGPCPMSEHGMPYDSLIGGHLPASYGTPNHRRVLIRATVVERNVTIDQWAGKGSGTIFEFIFDYALDDVTVLALYESACEFP